VVPAVSALETNPDQPVLVMETEYDTLALCAWAINAATNSIATNPANFFISAYSP
jgi:hypothetical protein